MVTGAYGAIYWVVYNLYMSGDESLINGGKSLTDSVQ